MKRITVGAGGSTSPTTVSTRIPGTIRARAVIANPSYFLAPGMFGNMRLADGGTTPALLIPDAAVRTDQARKIVLVVGKDDTVAAKPVETGPLVGNLRAIRSGLTRADRVIIQGRPVRDARRQGEAARYPDHVQRQPDQGSRCVVAQRVAGHAGRQLSHSKAKSCASVTSLSGGRSLPR